MNIKDGRSRAALTRRVRADATRRSTRRRLLGALAFGFTVFSAPCALFAQTPAKVWRIGVLHAGSRPTPGIRNMSTNFFEGMRELGYIEGRNLAVQWNFADNNLERLPELAAQLVKHRVDVIVANGTPAVRAAQQATSAIPIVVLGFVDPVGSGFAASLARPGGNITGVTNLGEETVFKRLEILSSVVPGVTRIAHLSNPDNPANARFLSRVEMAARTIGKDIVFAKARAANELSAAFELMARERAGALLVADDSILADARQRIGALALQRKLPVAFAWGNAAEDGLLTYAPNRTHLARRAAIQVDKIFKGAKPGDIPIEQPTSFLLVVNLKIARALGITIPQSVLVQATRVIE